jgi:hypothetical protein
MARRQGSITAGTVVATVHGPVGVFAANHTPLSSAK